MASPLARRAVLTQIAGRWLALPVEQVVETMRPLPIDPASPARREAVPYVLGTARIRGERVRVIDAARLFGLTSAAAPTRFVVVRTSAAPVALQVDAVIDVRALAPGTALEPVELVDLKPTLRDARWIEAPA